jgi:hypothetical protein
MSYFPTGTGVSAQRLDVDFSRAVALTADVNSEGADIGDRGTLRLDLTIPAGVTGTSPTLDVTLQTSADNATWRILGTFAQKTAAGTERKSFGGCDKFVRAVFDVGGTSPNFGLVSLKGYAV